LPALGIRGVVQGDFLFSSSDIQTKRIKGKSYVTFHPNTIIYAVPSDTEMAKQIKAAKIGIVWHTTYTGKTFETMKASYGVDVSKLKKTKDVWSQDAMLRDMTNFTMSKKDTEEVNEYLSEAGKLFNQISGSTLRQLERNKELAKLIEQFNNSYVRAGTVVNDTTAHTRKLIAWIKNKYQKEIDKRTTEKGKAAQQKALTDILSFFSPVNKLSLQKIFDLQKMIILAKLKLINILDRFNKISTFLKHTKNGYITTGSEGFVAIDTLGGDAVKIVDRMEFSYANFSPEILKGWQTPRRS
jgi:type I site-specific restriction-modification system R (restriction) subunit